MAGTSSYPGGIDDFALSSPEDLGDVDSKGRTHSKRHDDIEAAVVAIETELGVNPSGSSGTVADRFDTVDAIAAAAAVSASAAANSAAAAANSAAVIDAYESLPVEFRQFGSAGSVLDNLPVRVNPAESLLKQAVWWVDAGHSSASGQSVSNLGWGGSVLNARLGSSSGADSNDPIYLDWTGENYAYLPGVASNFLSVSHQASFNVTGDLDLRVYVAMDDWTPASSQNLLARWEGLDIAFFWYLQSSGFPRVYYRVGGSDHDRSSTAGVAFADGSPGWLRLTRNATSGDLIFYTSSDGSSWTQLGATVAGPTGALATTTAAPLKVGEYGSGGNPAAMKVYRAQMFSGIGGTKLVDIDTSVISSGAATSFTALTGQTVTINRSTSGRKSVCVVNPCWLFGTDDYMEVPARWLEHTGTNYVYLSGVASNYLSVPDEAALDITGDLDLRVRVAMDDWTPGSAQYVISKYGTAANHSYWLIVGSSGTLTLQWTADGTNVLGGSSTVATGLTDGSVKWIRATLDVNNGAAGRDLAFYTSDNGTTWTQLGTTVTQAGTTSIFSGTSSLWLGSLDGNNGMVAGKVFRAQVYNGIGGTLVLDVNTSVITGDVATFTAATGQTVTINRSGSTFQSYGVTESGYLVAGNPDSFQPSSYSLLDFGASDSFTVLAVVRARNTPSAFQVFVAKRTSSGAGYTLQRSSVGSNLFGSIEDSSASAVSRNGSSTYVQGNLSTVGLLVDRAAQTIATSSGSVVSATASIASVGSIANALPLRIGSNAGGGAVVDMEFIAAAVFRRALTSSEISTLTNYYAGRVGT